MGSLLQRAWTLLRQSSLVLTVLLLGIGGGCGSPKKTAAPVLPEGWLPSQGQVASVQGGGCLLRHPGEGWHRAKPGDWFGPGAELEVRSPSHATLRMFSFGLAVEVRPGTLLRFDKIAYRPAGDRIATAVILALRHGQVAVDRSGLTPDSEFEVHTPEGVSRIPPLPSR